MARPVKNIDGRSKEARAKRAKTVARKPRAITAPSFGRETSLRILALQIASNNIGRDTAPRDLVPMARQIDEFLAGNAQTTTRIDDADIEQRAAEIERRTGANLDPFGAEQNDKAIYS